MQVNARLRDVPHRSPSLSAVLAPQRATTESSEFAEEKRFELLDPVKDRRFSKPLPSTTRPLLQSLTEDAAESSKGPADR